MRFIFLEFVPGCLCVFQCISVGLSLSMPLSCSLPVSPSSLVLAAMVCEGFRNDLLGCFVTIILMSNRSSTG